MPMPRKANEWTKDSKIQEWFKNLGTQRTIGNYIHDFPKFLEWVQKNKDFKTPREIFESRLKDLREIDWNKKRSARAK